MFLKMWIVILCPSYWISISRTGICPFEKLSMWFLRRRTWFFSSLSMMKAETLKIKLTLRLKWKTECLSLMYIAVTWSTNIHVSMIDLFLTNSQLHGKIIARRDFNYLYQQPLSHGPNSYIKSSIIHQHIIFLGINRLLVNMESE